MSSETITSNDLKKILASAFPARANTTITSITLPYTPPCNGLFLGMLRATAQGRAYKQYSNTEPSLWDFYQTAGGYSTFASFVQAGKQIAETSTANISETPYYFFVPLDGTSPLFGGTADAVVEQGTSGIWTYRKWSSGIAECWGKTSIQPVCSRAFGNIYITQTSNPGVNYPFTFTSIVTENISTIGASGNCWVMAESTNYTTLSQAPAYWVCRPTQASSAMNVNISYYTMGTWK